MSDAQNYVVYKYSYKKTRPKSNFQIFKESLRSVTREYCAESSICGLKYLVSENMFYAQRIMWILTLVMAIICSAILVNMTFVNFYRAPLVTTQLPEGEPIDKIIFPAVGICTNNRISKSAVTKLAQQLIKESRNQNYSESEMLSLLFGLRQLYDFRIILPDSERLKLHRVLGDYDVNTLLRDLTPRCEDLLLNCAWNEETKRCDKLFDFRLTHNGYCCTFNYLRVSDNFDEDSSYRSTDMYKYGNKSAFDFDQGLKVLMKIDESDDFFYNVAMQGAQLQFSDAYDYPDATSGSFTMQVINPNVDVYYKALCSAWEKVQFLTREYCDLRLDSLVIGHFNPVVNNMSVLITASFTEASRDIEYVPIKQRQCLFHDESHYLQLYTYSDCFLKCRVLFLLEKCSCTPFNMPKIAASRTCDLRDVPCLRLYHGQLVSFRPIDTPAKDIPVELELDLVNGGLFCPMCYPTCVEIAYTYNFVSVDIYPEQLNSVPDSDRLDWLRGANFTGTSIVHVKYAREVADCYEQNVIMKWFDLISNIGSTCGFVTGLSFVSILEIIYFFVVKLYREIRSRRHQHFSNHRPLYWNEFAGFSRAGLNPKPQLHF